MKALTIKNMILAALMAVCFCACSFAAESDIAGTVAVVAMAAPAAVVIESFDIENLKIPMEEYQSLKVKHKHIYVLDIKIDDTEQYQFLARRPSRDLLMATAAADGDIAKINDLIIKNMVLAGDMEALDDGLVYGRLLKELGVLMKLGQGFLSKA